jgi:PAS domain S-box-containing protein
MKRLFAKQLAKATKANGEIDLDALERLVVAAYEDAERDRRRKDRAMSVMIKELEQAHSRLLDAFDAVPEGLALFDSEDRFVLWNRRYKEIHEDVFDELAVGMRFEDVLRCALAKGRYPEAIGREEEWLARRLEAHRQDQASFECALPGDRWIRVDERRTADGGSIGVRIDISDLRRREESFRLLFKANPIPMWIWDHETFQYLAVNDAAIEHYGYTREQFLSMNQFSIHPESEHSALRAIAVTGIEGERRHRIWHHIRADGSTIDAEVYAHSLKFEGRTASIVASINCTERNRAEKQLQQTREFLDTVFENVPTTIVVKDPADLRYILVNRAGERYYGFPREAMIGKTAYELLTADHANLVTELDKKALESRDIITHEHSIAGIDGITRAAVSKRIPICNAAGIPEHLLLVIEDVTEQRAMERQLQHAQKMEAIGSLSGGLAHDFNNLLTVIIGNADLLHEEIASDPAAAQKIDVVLQAALSGAELTRQLLAFSRRQPLRTISVNISELVVSSSRLIALSLGESIAIKLNTEPSLWHARTDSNQLQTAILNIAFNARDAMPNGGELTIRTRNVRFAVGEVPFADMAAGDYVAIEIADTGIGMSSDIANRVFEPFFTTKEQGKGTGLGLSMVYGFVQQSGGLITVSSEPGKGTTFTLYFQRAKEPMKDDATLSETPGAPHTNMERTSWRRRVVLAVDDNVEVLTSAVAQLEALGYCVLSANSPEAALKILGEPEPVDLLFTDVVMPGGLNGKRLAIEACRLRPDLKVLFTSGFPNAPEFQNLQAASDDALLAKPYRLQELERALRAVFDRDSVRAA